MVLAEERDLLYALRTMEVMMSSGIGLEAALLNLSQGGYGKISRDFAAMLTAAGKGKELADEIKRGMQKTKSKPYRRFLTTLHNNMTRNTDVVDDLKKQGDSEEESRECALRASHWLLLIEPPDDGPKRPPDGRDLSPGVRCGRLQCT